MNLEVSEENLCKVLQDVRELLKDNILPRLTQLEEEVRLLREVTWPVCQSLTETSQLIDMHNKRRFLSILDEIEATLPPDEPGEGIDTGNSGELKG